MIHKQDYLGMKDTELITLIRYASEILEERMIGLRTERGLGRVIVPKIVRGNSDKRLLPLVRVVRNIADLDLRDAIRVVESGAALDLPEEKANELARAIAEIMGEKTSEQASEERSRSR